jgi:hypothetical protein
VDGWVVGWNHHFGWGKNDLKDWLQQLTSPVFDRFQKLLKYTFWLHLRHHKNGCSCREKCKHFFKLIAPEINLNADWKNEKSTEWMSSTTKRGGVGKHDFKNCVPQLKSQSRNFYDSFIFVFRTLWMCKKKN